MFIEDENVPRHSRPLGVSQKPKRTFMGWLMLSKLKLMKVSSAGLLTERLCFRETPNMYTVCVTRTPVYYV